MCFFQPSDGISEFLIPLRVSMIVIRGQDVHIFMTHLPLLCIFCSHGR